jgi:hypothetical protein
MKDDVARDPEVAGSEDVFQGGKQPSVSGSHHSGNLL